MRVYVLSTSPLFFFFVVVVVIVGLVLRQSVHR